MWNVKRRVEGGPKFDWCIVTQPDLKKRKKQLQNTYFYRVLNFSQIWLSTNQTNSNLSSLFTSTATIPRGGLPNGGGKKSV